MGSRSSSIFCLQIAFGKMPQTDMNLSMKLKTKQVHGRCILVIKVYCRHFFSDLFQNVLQDFGSLQCAKLQFSMSPKRQMHTAIHEHCV